MRVRNMFNPNTRHFRHHFFGSGSGFNTKRNRDDSFYLKKNRWYIVTDAKGEWLFQSEHEGLCYQWMNNIPNGQRKQYRVIATYKESESSE